MLGAVAALALAQCQALTTGFWSDTAQRYGVRAYPNGTFDVTGNIKGRGRVDERGHVTFSQARGLMSQDCMTIKWTGAPPAPQGDWHLNCPGPLEDGVLDCGGTVHDAAICCATGEECIRGDMGQPACKPVPNFKKIHVVYMTHLDLGYTDSTHNVCDAYWHPYFPNAINVSKTLEKRGGRARFRWTEFPWIIQEYLDGAAGCGASRPSPEEITVFEEAIRDDRIVWQANALNFLTEVLDEPMWDETLRMKDVLNARFGKKWGLAGKLSDTTGMSRSAIPMLAKNGVRAFHIGYNGVGGLPAVPSTFKWQHPETGTSLLTMIENNYGKVIDIPAGAELTRVHAGTDVALYYLYTQDNTGPPTVEQVEHFWAGLEAEHPEAEIVASTLDDFTRDLERADTMRLIPTVDAELGDTWHYGAQADPVKVATFREARRVMQEEVAAGRLQRSSALYNAYLRRLMKGPCEHNWGLSSGIFLPELRTADTWDNAFFHKRRGSLEYQKLEREWAEQREWMHPQQAWSYKYGWTRSPTTALPKGVQPAPTLAEQRAFAEFAARLEGRLLPLMFPEMPAVSGKRLAAGVRLQCGNASLTLAKDGALASLVDASGREWSRGEGIDALARLSYLSFSAKDFAQWQKEYTSAGDFLKQGFETANPVGREWFPTLHGAAYTKRGDACEVVAHVAFAREVVQKYGAPAKAYLSYRVPGAGGGPADITVHWEGKTATRLPEAMFLSFNPRVHGPIRDASWTLDVIGHPVRPESVVDGGTKWKHFVQSGATLHEGARSTLFEFVDVGTVGIGRPENILRFCPTGGYGLDQTDCTLPNLAQTGVHAVLYNNLWGTAFPQWYDDDGLARFRIRPEQ